MGRFDRKIQRKHLDVRRPLAFDRASLQRAGFTLVAEGDEMLADLPPLAMQLEHLATPILASYPGAPEQVLQTILAFVVMSWNLGFMALHDRGATVEQLVQVQFGQALRNESPKAREQTLGMIRSLIRMRMEFFGHDPRIIESATVKQQGNGYQIQTTGVGAVRVA